jgi:oxygen-independent coproporphyrinogen-3 oxidase
MTDTVGPALGVYIHWPYCARICPYCDFNVVRERGRALEQAALVEAMADDLRAHAAITGPMRLASIFLGGGTPSLMAPADAGRLIALCKSLWTAEPDLEVTLEANPTDAEAERFADFARAGVNRLSLGVQALDDAALVFLGRNHDAAAAIRAVETAASVFPSLSLDLIYALPGQTATAWAQALAQADALGAAHISAYQLTIAEGTPFERAVQRGRFAPVDPELAATLYETTQATLEALGYVAYEISNHAKSPAARSRHNLVYWRGEAYVGVGPGAHGRLSTPQGRLAVEAQARIADYITAVAKTGRGWSEGEVLEPRAVLEERVFMGLRTEEGVPTVVILELAAALKAGELIAAGLLRLRGERLSATPRGRLVLDRVVAELLT